MILVDTSVIADIFSKDPDWFDWSSEQIENWADQGAVCYDQIIFAELAVKFDSHKELENRLSAWAAALHFN
jgi:predicted nucleic acid-binding protein